MGEWPSVMAVACLTFCMYEAYFYVLFIAYLRHDSNTSDNFCVLCATNLQLIVTAIFSGEVGEVHDLDNQAGPSSEMLGTLARACLGIVLLPSEASLAPRLVHSIDQVLAQLGVHRCCALLLRARLLSDVLLPHVSTRAPRSQFGYDLRASSLRSGSSAASIQGYASSSRRCRRIRLSSSSFGSREATTAPPCRQ